MKKLLSAFMLAALATGCATAPEPVAATYVPAGSVQEVAWTLPEPVPVGDGEFPYIPTNAQQIECRTAEGARAIQNASRPVYDEYERDGVDWFWLTAAVADVMGNTMQDLRAANICRMRDAQD